MMRPLVRFNPRPASRSGDALVACLDLHERFVSIRARPHGRAMRHSMSMLVHANSFQSAPGLTVGRCSRASVVLRASARFNPRPASRSGDATWRYTAAALCDGGFNPRPASRSGDALGHLQQHRALVAVSIRARPHGRAMLAQEADLRQGRAVSIRARPHGRAMRDSDPYTRLAWRFNPRPASRSGDALDACVDDFAEAMFQSAPGLTVGRCCADGFGAAWVVRFQSAPGLTVGRCWRILWICRRT